MNKELPTWQDVEAEARAKGMSLNELYRRADINKTTFWNWRQGKDINLSTLQKLLAALENTTG